MKPPPSHSSSLQARDRDYQLKVKAADSRYYSDALSAGNPAGIAGWSDTVNFEVVSETRVPGPSVSLLLVALSLVAVVLLSLLLMSADAAGRRLIRIRNRAKN